MSEFPKSGSPHKAACPLVSGDFSVTMQQTIVADKRGADVQALGAFFRASQ